MGKTTFFVLAILALLAAAFFYISFVLDSTGQSPAPPDLEECNTLSFNGDDKTNLVFISTEADAKKYSDSLFTYSPLNKNKDQFNIYYISNYQPKCELYKGIALFCHSKELVKKASSCPSDYIIALQPQKSGTRSSAYLNVMSINSNHKLSVFAHEFGHAFANLAEEYTPAKIPSKSNNCQTSCSSFDVKDGCFQGCSESSYSRSINLGIMRTLSSSKFGIFNEKTITERISKSSSSITGLAIGLEQRCIEQTYYLIGASYNQQGSLNVISKTLETGCPGSNGFGPLDYEVFDKSGSTLLTKQFNPEIVFTDSESLTSDLLEGETYTYDGIFYFKIPYSEEVKSVKVSGKEICQGFEICLSGECESSLPATQIQACGPNCVTDCLESGSRSLPISEQGLIAFLPLDTDLSDLSPEDNSGTCLSSNCPEQVEGKINSGYLYDGYNDYIQIPLSGYNIQQGSVALWAKYIATNPEPESYLFGLTTDAEFNNRIQLYTDDTQGQLDMGIGLIHQQSLAIKQLPTNQWTHVALIWQEPQYSVYVNGQIESSGTYQGLDQPAQWADIGNSGNPETDKRRRAFNGTIDEFVMFSRALSADEISTLYLES
tara:strand:+ start:1702 stop:3510 length:1809 start_codon:yes stop_codon:yes gene_type:complete